MSQSLNVTDSSRQTDRQILGYSRYVVMAAAFSAMFIISPFEYAWSSMSAHLAKIYGWSHEQVALMFTLFILCQSIGMLPGGVLRDKYGPRWTTAVSGLFAALGILAIALGPNYAFVLILWSIGSFFSGFIYNNAVSTGNKWFPDRRGLVTGLIAGAFSWGSLPFIFPIRDISAASPPEAFLHIIYVITAVVAVVSVVAAMFMKDPPVGWRPNDRTVQKKAVERPCEHDYAVGEALKTWQMWILICSFVFISSAGLAGMSKIVAYSESFRFAATAATAAAGGIALANGFGKLILGALSQRFGIENMMVVSYATCGLFLFMTIYAGSNGDELLFVCAAILAIFFWASLFSLFPIAIGYYFGPSSAGGNYGILYAIAKGSGGLYGGILSTLLIMHFGFSLAIALAGGMAIVAGLVVIPLKYSPPIWRGPPKEPGNKKTATGRVWA